MQNIYLIYAIFQTFNAREKQNPQQQLKITM